MLHPPEQPLPLLTSSTDEIPESHGPLTTTTIHTVRTHPATRDIHVGMKNTPETLPQQQGPPSDYHCYEIWA